MADKWKSKPEDFEKTRQIVVDVDALKPKPGPAMTQETKVREFQVTLVKIPLPGTREVAEKYEQGKGGWTSDDEGQLDRPHGQARGRVVLESLRVVALHPGGFRGIFMRYVEFKHMVHGALRGHPPGLTWGSFSNV